MFLFSSTFLRLRKERKVSKSTAKKEQEKVAATEFSFFSRLRFATKVDKEFSQNTKNSNTKKNAKIENTDLADKIKKEQKEEKRKSSEKKSDKDGEKKRKDGKENKDNKEKKNKDKNDKNNKIDGDDSSERGSKKRRSKSLPDPKKSSLWKSATPTPAANAPKIKSVRFGMDETEFQNVSVADSQRKVRF